MTAKERVAAFLIALALLLVASLGHSEEQTKGAKADIAWLAVGGAADLASTEWALARGGVEANPLMQSRGGRALVKVASTVAVVAAISKLRRDGHPRAAKVLRYVVTGALVGLAAHNVQMGRRVR